MADDSLATKDDFQVRLLRRATLARVKALSSVLAGIPLCLLGPLVLGSMFWVSSGILFALWYPWMWFFGGATAITLPLLFRLELRTSGDFLGDVAKAAGPGIPGADLLIIGAHLRYGAIAGGLTATVTSPRLASAGFIEFFLVGPRLVVGGYRFLKQVRKLGRVDIQRIADIVFRLMSRTEGMPIAEMTLKDASRADLVPAFAWLVIHGWIGVSEDNERVYLYSESRRKLAGE